MDARPVAHAYQLQQIALARQIATEVMRHWRGMDTANLAHSWAAIAGPVFALVAGAQALAASAADPYVTATLDGEPPPAGVNAFAFAGVASDGRPLASLLAEPVITVKTLIGGGATVARAMLGGATQLDMIVRTQIADAGRVASGVAITSRERVSYVRMVSPGACSRCVVLAGKRYGWNARFLRHPRCHCTAIPVTEDVPGDIMTNPKAYFGHLSTAEQDRTFTKAGAQAIRDGAELGQVVNARRGMYAAGDRKFTTTAAKTRGAGGVRLMPEQIYAEAAGNRAEAIRLLQRHGYLTQSPAAAPLARTFDDRIAAAAVERDALAAARAALGRRTAGMLPLTRAEQTAGREYVSSFYYAINGQLRRGDLAGSAAREIEAIDAVMDRAALARDVAVWRGIADAERLFGPRLAADLTGFEWRELAYTSTSASRLVAQDFTYQSGQVLMRLLVPSGTGAMRLSGMGAGEQAELLLRRGLHLRVVADRGISPEGYRLLDVEVLR